MIIHHFLGKATFLQHDRQITQQGFQISCPVAHYDGFLYKKGSGQPSITHRLNNGNGKSQGTKLLQVLFNRIAGSSGGFTDKFTAPPICIKT